MYTIFSFICKTTIISWFWVNFPLSDYHEIRCYRKCMNLRRTEYKITLGPLQNSILVYLAVFDTDFYKMIYNIFWSVFSKIFLVLAPVANPPPPGDHFQLFPDTDMLNTKELRKSKI